MEHQGKTGPTLCKICEIAERKYICPKCGIPYCSLNCYQNLEKHITCSESFYRDCVEMELKAEADPTKAKKMEEILQRFKQQYNAEEHLQSDESDDQEEDDLDSDDDEPLAKRLESVNLDDADEVWKSLTYEERENFKLFAQKNLKESEFPEWVPWWTIPIKKVEEIPECESTNLTKMIQSNVKLNNVQPDILDPIPTMASLTKITPSLSVKLGLANVVGAYVWTSRLFGGDFIETDDSNEIAYTFVSLSSFLRCDQLFESFQQAISDVLQNVSKFPDLFDGGPGLQSNLQRDAYMVLTGGLTSLVDPFSSAHKLAKSYVLSALTECHKLLSVKLKNIRKLKCKKLRKNSKDNEASSSLTTTVSMLGHKNSEEGSFRSSFSSKVNHNDLDPNIYSKALRKIYYLLAFANEFDIL